ncbi:recombination regulator RecX [Burkholderiaceae bacterium DAT-1]|nr:recombination regulator RecX [Burkholderiaceae bacterium DAT-1]
MLFEEADPSPSDAPPLSDDKLRDFMLRLLSRREHSRLELSQKLMQKGATPEQITALLEYFVARNWQSDQRFAEQYFNSYRSKHGEFRLRQSLQSHGIDGQLIDMVIAHADHPDGNSELDRARAILLKKFRTSPTNANEYKKQASFLYNRGFSFDLIRKILKEP